MVGRSSRLRAGTALAAIGGLAAALARCDTSDHHVVVNDSGEALTISVEEASSPFLADFVRGEANELGDAIAPGADTSAYLMGIAGWFVVIALASDRSVNNMWQSLDGPERPFTLSPATGTCPQRLPGAAQT